jgi:hypothetical protein
VSQFNRSCTWGCEAYQALPVLSVHLEFLPHDHRFPSCRSRQDRRCLSLRRRQTAQWLQRHLSNHHRWCAATPHLATVLRHTSQTHPHSQPERDLRPLVHRTIQEPAHAITKILPRRILLCSRMSPDEISSNPIWPMAIPPTGAAHEMVEGNITASRQDAADRHQGRALVVAAKT